MDATTPGETSSGVALLNAGRWVEAEAEFRREADDNPRDPYARHNLGVALAGQAKFKQAIPEYELACELWLASDDADDRKFALFAWASALIATKANRLAIEKYRQAIDLDRDYADAHLNLGIALMAEDQFTDAIKEYELADRIWRRDKDYDKRKLALAVWGDALRLRGDNESAVERYEEAIEINPRYADARQNLGITLVALDRLNDAIRHFKCAEELWREEGSPNLNLALDGQANAHRLTGDALARRPQDALARRQQFDDVIEQYRLADELWTTTGSPDRKLALIGWADALRLGGDNKSAIAKYKEAILDYPEFANAQFGLGLALQTEGQVKDAIIRGRVPAGGVAPGGSGAAREARPFNRRCSERAA